jgi:hypothetical protein
MPSTKLILILQDNIVNVFIVQLRIYIVGVRSAHLLGASLLLLVPPLVLARDSKYLRQRATTFFDCTRSASASRARMSSRSASLTANK